MNIGDISDPKVYNPETARMSAGTAGTKSSKNAVRCLMLPMIRPVLCIIPGNFNAPTIWMTLTTTNAAVISSIQTPLLDTFVTFTKHIYYIIKIKSCNVIQ